MMEENPISFIHLGGGLNNRVGIFNISENESSDLNNIDFNKFGSLLKRKGYYYLNSTTIPDTNAKPWIPSIEGGYGVSGDFGIPFILVGYGITTSTRYEEIIDMPIPNLSFTTE